MSWLFFFLLIAIFIYFLVRSAIAHQSPHLKDELDLDDLDDDTEIIVEVQPTIVASMEVKYSNYPIDVIGESRHRETLDEICGRPELKVSMEKPAVLIPAEKNPYAPDRNPPDKNPMRVTIEGKTVGYLDPEDSSDFAERFGRITMKCMARIEGGGWVKKGRYRGNYGVRITYDRHG